MEFNMKNFDSKMKQAGISLLEVLLSLAIISIILVMAMQYFTTASNNQKLNMVRTFIGADMAAIQGFGVNNNGFKDEDGANVSWKKLVDSGYLSKDTKSLNCTTDSCNQVTPWGENVALDINGSVVSLQVPLPDPIFCTNLQQSYGSKIVDCTSKEGNAIVYINGYTAST
jgi:type II secretory pathway pseudopilin PulG